MTVSRRLRFEVLRRDGYACRYCGASAPDVSLTIDHVIPVTLGGGDDPTNLVTACGPCNAGKTSTGPDEHIVEDVDAAALLFAQAIEVAAARRLAARKEAHRATDLFHEEWTDWGYGTVDQQDRERVPLPTDWQASIERFYALGLHPEDDMYDFIRIAMTAPGLNFGDQWKYFCGICWKEIKERQELARQLIEDGEV